MVPDPGSYRALLYYESLLAFKDERERCWLPPPTYMFLYLSISSLFSCIFSAWFFSSSMILLISYLLPCSSPSSTWLLLSNSLEVSWEASYTLASKLLSLSFCLVNPLFSSSNFACRSNYFSFANLSSSMSYLILPGYAVSSPSLTSSFPCSFCCLLSILNSFSRSLFYV